MTGMEHATEKAARIIVREVGDRIERFPLVEPISMQAARQYARALAEAGCSRLRRYGRNGRHATSTAAAPSTEPATKPMPNWAA